MDVKTVTTLGSHNISQTAQTKDEEKSRTGQDGSQKQKEPSPFTAPAHDEKSEEKNESCELNCQLVDSDTLVELLHHRPECPKTAQNFKAALKDVKKPSILPHPSIDKKL